MSSWLRHGSGDAPLTVARVQHLEQVETNYHELLGEYQNLQGKVKKLEDKLQAQREELKRLQAIDFASRKKESSKSHDAISQSLDEVFSKSVDWSREYFKIDLKDFSLDEFKQFKKNLRWVLWSDCNWRTKRFLNVSHLVQAVVADFLAIEILHSPFKGCEQGFERHCGGLYKAMLKDNREQAHRWRATTLSAYEKFGEWPPVPDSARARSRSTPTESVSWHREKYYDAIAEKINSITGPITHKYFPERKDDEERIRKCREFIKAAGEVAVELGKHGAELKVVDKYWFKKSGRIFVCDDERMKDRFGEDNIDPRENPRVDIVLRPGLLKYGNDEGENFENYSVWIPALVDLSRGNTSQADSKTATRTRRRSTAHKSQLHEIPPAEYSGSDAKKQPQYQSDSQATDHGNPIQIDSEYIDSQLATTPPTSATSTS